MRGNWQKNIEPVARPGKPYQRKPQVFHAPAPTSLDAVQEHRGIRWLGHRKSCSSAHGKFVQDRRHSSLLARQRSESTNFNTCKTTSYLRSFFLCAKEYAGLKKVRYRRKWRYWLISARDNIMIWDCSFESQSLLFSEKSLCVYLRVLCENLQKRGKHKSCHNTRVVEMVGSNSLRALAWMTWKDI